MGARNYDLFGQPLPLRLGKPGRNDHVPTPENVSKVRVLLAAEWTRGEIAAELGISVPTLRKHYFRELARGREVALRELRGKIMLSLEAQMEKGNVGAAKALLAIVQKSELLQVPEQPKQPVPLGKKERRRIEARDPAGSWEDILEQGLPN